MESFSLNYRIFLYVIGMITGVNLLILNDWLTVWNEVEAQSLLTLLPQSDQSTSALLPHWIWQQMYSIDGPNHWLLRLPSAIFIVLASYLSWLWGQKIFGVKSMWYFLVVLCASLLVPFLSKWAAVDVFLFSIQLISYILLILTLKQPIWKWRLAFLGSYLLGLLVNPLEYSIYITLIWGLLYLRHPNRTNLRVGLWIPFITFIVIGLLVSGWLAWPSSGQLLGYWGVSPWYSLLLQLLGMLPWLAFLAPALHQLSKRWRKKEELAIITGSWLIAGLLTQGLILQAALAFLTAKQLEAYFQERYPYRSWVKGVAALLLVGSCCLLIGAMLLGWQRFGGAGFRAIMLLALCYWGCSLIGTIGLYGLKKSWVHGGLAMSGLLFSVCIWWQLAPLAEQSLAAPKWAAKEGLAIEAKEWIICSDYLANQANFYWYVHSKAESTNLTWVKADELTAIIEDKAEALMIINEKGLAQLGRIAPESAKYYSPPKQSSFPTEELWIFPVKALQE